MNIFQAISPENLLLLGVAALVVLILMRGGNSNEELVEEVLPVVEATALLEKVPTVLRRLSNGGHWLAYARLDRVTKAVQKELDLRQSPRWEDVEQLALRLKEGEEVLGALRTQRA